MKKTILTIFSLVFIVQLVFSGGIVTNTNQSAAWVRSMVRDASVDVDAVFFNPAGLTHLEDGFYLQVNSQTVMQGRTVTSTYPTLNDGTYEGSTFVPVLPTGFAVYKKGKLAVSAGFTVIGGGGSATFDRGLPQFEQQISTLPASLAGLAAVGEQAGVDLSVSGYSADIEFSGSSAYYGIQAGLSYQINDMISVGIGGRYIMANNTYTGSIENISLMTAAGTQRADEFLTGTAIPTVTGVKNELQGNADQLGLVSAGLDLLIAGGFGGLTVEQLINSGALSQEQITQINFAMFALGLDPTTLTLNDVNGIVEGTVGELNANITQLAGTEAALTATAANLGDQLVDVTQSGTGFTPIISVDFNLLEGDLGIALKYEHKTNMKVTTKVTRDDTGTYIDGEEVTSDMPAMLSAGIRYRLSDAFRAQAGFHYYLDMGASYGKKDDDGNFVNNGEETTIGGVTTSYLAGNSYEAALGLEYDVTNSFTLSGGFLYTASNPNDVYQSGLSYTLNTTTFGLGAKIRVMKNLAIDLGYSNTSYVVYTKALNDPVFGAYEESYDKTASVFALGLTLGF
jgi:long-subunit fatty acid transport protein